MKSDMKNILLVGVGALMLFTSCDKGTMDDTSEKEPWGIQCMTKYNAGPGGQPWKVDHFQGKWLERVYTTEDKAAAMCAAVETHSHSEMHNGVSGPPMVSKFYKARLVPMSQDKGLDKDTKYYWVWLITEVYTYASTGEIYDKGPNYSGFQYYPEKYTWERFKDMGGVPSPPTKVKGPNGEDLIKRDTWTYHRQLKKEW